MLRIRLPFVRQETKRGGKGRKANFYFQRKDSDSKECWIIFLKT